MYEVRGMNKDEGALRAPIIISHTSYFILHTSDLE
jgi:hypothetical protein